MTNRATPVAESHRTVVKNTVALALSKVIYRGTTVVVSVFVGRVLGPGGLGVYSTALVLQGVIALAATMGSSNYLVREIAKDKSRTADYLFHMGVMGSAVALIGTAIVLVILPWLGYSVQLTAAVKIIVLALVPGVLGTIQEAVFIAHQRADFITYTGCISALVYSGASLFLLFRGFGILSLVIAFVTMQYIQSTLYYLLIHRYIAILTWHFDVRFALTTLRDIRAFAGMSLLGGVLARPEIIVLSVLRNEVQVGLYGAALRLVDVWQLVPQVYMMNVFPVLSRSYGAGDQTHERIRKESITYLMAVSLPATVVTFAAARPIMHLLYGGQFDGGVPMLRILSVTIALSSVMAVLWRVLAARDEQGRVFRAQVWAAAGRLGVGYLLILRWSALGAAISTTAFLGLHSVLLARYVQRDGTRLRLLALTWRIAVACLPVLVLLAIPAVRAHFLIGAPIAMVAYTAVLLLLSRSDIRERLRMDLTNGR